MISLFSKRIMTPIGVYSKSWYCNMAEELSIIWLIPCRRLESRAILLIFPCVDWMFCMAKAVMSDSCGEFGLQALTSKGSPGGGGPAATLEKRYPGLCGNGSSGMRCRLMGEGVWAMTPLSAAQKQTGACRDTGMDVIFQRMAQPTEGY